MRSRLVFVFPVGCALCFDKMACNFFWCYITVPGPPAQ
jgi:hypothetical protein